MRKTHIYLPLLVALSAWNVWAQNLTATRMNASELRLPGSTSGYVGFAASAAAGSTTYTWPNSAGTNGQVLTTNGSGGLTWSTPSVSSQWTTSGSNIYYNTGNVGIGTSDLSFGARLTVAGAASSQSSIMVWNPGIGSGQIGFSASSSNLKIYNTYTDGLLANGKGVDIASNGNVGIGTTAPDVALVLSRGSGGVGGTEATALEIRNDASGVNTAAALYFTPNTAGIRARAASIRSRQTIAGNVADLGFFTANADTPVERMTITTAGNVGIGTTTPGYLLQVAGAIGATAFTNTSDQTLKKNVTPIQGALEKLLKIQGVRFEWKDPTIERGVQMGVIAQNVEKEFPELVTTDTQGIKSVKYAQLAAPLIEATRELHERLKSLEKENADLKAWACSQKNSPATCRR